MAFTIVRARRHSLPKAAVKPALAAPRPKALNRPILHLKTPSAA
jgi:hypothetical protein